MRAILISIQPQWLEKILNGEKTIEVRKSMPKCDLPVDVYLYCTKGYKSLQRWDKRLCDNRSFYMTDHNKTSLIPSNTWNGKIVAKFTLSKVDIIDCTSDKFVEYSDEMNEHGTSCLSFDDLMNYCNGQNLYAWHITDLVIFDKPIELGEFETYNYKLAQDENQPCPWRKLTRAPQSWQYVEANS